MEENCEQCKYLKIRGDAAQRVIARVWDVLGNPTIFQDFGYGLPEVVGARLESLQKKLDCALERLKESEARAQGVEELRKENTILRIQLGQAQKGTTLDFVVTCDTKQENKPTPGYAGEVGDVHFGGSDY